MGTVNEGINKIALIVIIIILLVYAAGFATDAGAVTSGITGIVGSLLPRNSQGNFAGYPSGSAKNATQQNLPPTARNG